MSKNCNCEHYCNGFCKIRGVECDLSAVMDEKLEHIVPSCRYYAPVIEDRFAPKNCSVLVEYEVYEQARKRCDDLEKSLKMWQGAYDNLQKLYSVTSNQPETPYMLYVSGRPNTAEDLVNYIMNQCITTSQLSILTYELVNDPVVVINTIIDNYDNEKHELTRSLRYGYHGYSYSTYKYVGNFANKFEAIQYVINNYKTTYAEVNYTIITYDDVIHQIMYSSDDNELRVFSLSELAGSKVMDEIGKNELIAYRDKLIEERKLNNGQENNS